MASPPPTAEGADKHAAAHQDDQDDGDGDDHQEQPKKKRNLPGTPDPHAEVIALSPKTLMATNRFLCEVCGKGFQRDQNLQLHRRGHNLPWKLKQREGQEIKKRVYVCPEVTCVHHEPSRALGDLTGIKKHFSRKHGEKKWKCEKCSKRYAVQSDWKAHQKVCGTREYRCDCGTLFSRRDTFITHRAYCDALAQENAKVSGQRKVDRELSAGHDGSVLTSRDGDFSRVTDAPPSSVSRIASGASGKEAPTKEAGKNSTLNKVGAMGGPCAIRSCDPTVKVPVLSLCLGTGLGPGPPEMGLKSRSNGSLQWPLPLSNAGVHASNSNPDAQEHGMGDRGSTGMAGLSLGVSSMVGSSTISDSIGPSVGSAEFLGNAYMFPRYYKQPSAIGTQLPATTLLQKAAMMGSTSSRSNLLRSLGRGGDSSSVPQGGSLHDSLSGSVVGTTSSSRLPFSETRGGALCTTEHGGRPLSGKEGAAWGSNSSFSSAKNLLLDGKQNHAEVAQSDSLPDQSRVPDGVAHDCSLAGEPDRLTLDFLGVGGLAVSTGQTTTHKDVTGSTLEVGSISRNP